MQTSLLQEASHGWNVVYEGFAYPFKTYNAALKLQNALWLLTEENALGKFKKLRAHPSRPNYVARSYNYFIENEHMVDDVIAIARAESRAKARARGSFPLMDYLSKSGIFGGIQGARTGRTCAGASMLAPRVNVLKSRFSPEPGLGKTVFFLSDLHLGHPKLKLDIDSVLNEKWPSTPFRPFKGFNYAQQEERVLAQQASPAPAPVVVESIDPRKIPLLAYVNAEFLPDAPKDDTDVSTKACWQRQASTIHGLLRDLEGRDKRNMHLSTELEISKSRVKELEGIVGRQAGSIQNQSGYISTLRDERDSYKGQVLKNTESIAVVKYSQRDHEWHLVQNGIAWRQPHQVTFNTLVHIANSINLGKTSVGSFGLIRKLYYYKEDYA